MTLVINFKGAKGFEDRIDIPNPEYIPNIGDDIHNNKQTITRFFVERKSVFYNSSGTNVIIYAVERL